MSKKKQKLFVYQVVIDSQERNSVGRETLLLLAASAADACGRVELEYSHPEFKEDVVFIESCICIPGTLL